MTKTEFIILRLSPNDKERIRTEADKMRLSISSYTRLQLINNLNNI